MSATEQASASSYLKHIQGLRAIAVLSVVLFHIDANLCPGGFVGVDVFFVISGFLITRGLLEELQQNRFSLGNFYFRRIRRIMPAYFALIIGVMLAGVLVYPSSKIVNLSSTALASLGFVANLFFFQQKNDYFAAATHDNPLLNLWSLAVEEQFYLFIPLLMALLWSRGKLPRVRSAMWCLTAASLAGCIYSSYSGSANAAYLLPHTRAWELLARVLLACYLPKQSARQAPRFAAIGSIAAALLLGCSFIFIDSNSIFPGYIAIFAVAAAVLAIALSGHGLAGKLLGHAAADFFGKISYSLYLWHWPVIVFWRYMRINQTGYVDYLGMLALSVALSYCSWRWVEEPLRHYAISGKRRLFSFNFALTAFCALLLGIIIRYDAFPGQLNPLANRAQLAIGLPSRISYKQLEPQPPAPWQRDMLKDKELLYIGDDRQLPAYLLWGDSHAGALLSGLDELLQQHKAAGLYYKSGNIPFRGMDIYSAGKIDRHSDDIEALLGFVEANPHLQTVIIANRWALRATGRWYKGDAVDAKPCQLMRRSDSSIAALDDPSYMQQGLEATLRELKRLGRRVVLIGPTPEKTTHIPDLLARYGDYQQAAQALTSQQQFMQRNASSLQVLQALASKYAAAFIPAHEALFDGSNYTAFEKNQVFYYDDDHLSNNGARRVMQYFSKLILHEADDLAN